MGGEPVEVRPYLIPPLGVAVRKSSDVLAVDDADVSAAVRFIREHACHGIAVKELLQAVPLSRRVLEGRFRRLLGRTPHEEIARVRFERVRQLLRQTRLPLSEVAERSGFRNAEYLATAFRRAFGTSPSAYRNETGVTFSG
jgi:LacI family transcriptional regulator